MMNRINTRFRDSKVPLRTFGVFGITLLIAVSITWWCTRSYYQHNNVIETTLSSLNNSLINCSNFIQNTNSVIFNDMEEKLKDPGRKEKALIWNSRAKSALTFTQNIQNYLLKLKSYIRGSNNYERFGKDKEYFYKPDISEGLYDSLNNFNNYLLNLIPNDMKYQLGVLPVQALTSNDQIKNKDEWYQYNFESLDTTATIAMLSKIESDVLRSTNIVLNFMNYQNESLILYDEFYMPFVSQNSTVLLSGQILEITAGLGAYISTFHPIIKINDNDIPVNNQGIGEYKQTVGNEKNGSILVSITYKDPNTGKHLMVSKSINYTVFQPPKK